MSMPDQQFFLFITITIVLTITPGADTILVLRNVLRGGLKDGAYTSIGICSGLFVHASLSALGISIILVSSATLFNIVKMVGAGYLIWLGTVSLFNAVRQTNSNALSSIRTINEKVRELRSVREGLLSNVLNPKPAVFYLSFFPQFVERTDSIYCKTMYLASIQFVVGMVWLILLSLIITRMKGFIVKTSIKRILDGISGSFLIAFGLKISLQNK